MLMMVLPFLLWWLLVRLAAYRQAQLTVTKEGVSVSFSRRFTLWNVHMAKENVQWVQVSQNIIQKKTGSCHVRVALYSETNETFLVKRLPYQRVKQYLEEQAKQDGQEG